MDQLIVHLQDLLDAHSKVLSNIERDISSAKNQADKFMFTEQKIKCKSFCKAIERTLKLIKADQSTR